jgi:tRNA(fMet)-specific endonuclease VapC
VGAAMTAGDLLDTNHLGHAMTPVSAVRDRIVDLRTRGEKVGTCIPVLCEIEAGILQVSQPERYRESMRRLLLQVRLWPLDGDTARGYGRLHQDLKRRGRVLSQVDIMLAALAQQMDLTLVTSDRDFEAVADLRTENWLG